MNNRLRQRYSRMGRTVDILIESYQQTVARIDWTQPYRTALVREWLPTRLGDGTVTVAVSNLVSPFTQARLTALPIPGRWLRGVIPPEKAVDAIDGEIQVGPEAFGYGRLGLVRR